MIVFIPSYSGKQSEAFWAAVNEKAGYMYELAVKLQDIEDEVLDELNREEEK